MSAEDRGHVYIARYLHILQVKLNVSLLEDISDDLDFCMKLAKEESVIIVPAGKIRKILQVSLTKMYVSTYIC